MKYLVTDDSKMARKMLIKSLKELVNDNVEILEATNGQEAVEYYKANQPNICFMDLTMPVMDGFDAVKNICEYDNKAKIIVVTADIQEGSKQRARENGAIGFIKKPANKDNLETMLKELGLI